MKKIDILKFFKILSLCSFIICVPSSALASSEESAEEVDPASVTPVIGYYEMKKPYLTNLSNNGNKLNYLRVQVVIVLNDSRDNVLIEEHEPLISDAIVTILSSKSFDEVKTTESQNNRKIIEEEIKKKLTELTDTYVGRRIIKNVLFTDYVVQ